MKSLLKKKIKIHISAEEKVEGQTYKWPSNNYGTFIKMVEPDSSVVYGW